MSFFPPPLPYLPPYHRSFPHQFLSFLLSPPPNSLFSKASFFPWNTTAPRNAHKKRKVGGGFFILKKKKTNEYWVDALDCNLEEVISHPEGT